MHDTTPMQEFITIDDGNCPAFEIAIPRKRSSLLDWYVAGKKNDDLALLILRYLNGSGTLIDVGANIGMITVPVAISGSHVLGIELVPENSFYLHLSILKNDLRNVHVFQCAAGDRRGITGYAGIEVNAYVSSTGHPALEFPLDDIIDMVEKRGVGFINPPIFLKIDTEGYELRVLKGAPRILKDFSPIIAFESITIEGSNSNQEASARQVKALLEGLGYYLYMHHNRILSPRSSKDIQERHVVDFIATKESLTEGSEFCGNLVRPLRLEESIDYVREMLLWSEPYRMHAAGVIARWLREGSGNAVLWEIAQQIRNDASQQVREYADEILSGAR